MTNFATGDQSVSSSFVVGDVVLVRDVRGDVTITTQRPPYRVEMFPTAALPLSVADARAQPAKLLQPRYAAVPFAGRVALLDDLSGWLGKDGAVSVRLIHAGGGQGKTRLAGHLAAGCAASGWAVWRLHHTPSQSLTSQTAMPTHGGVLAIVDYAERWPLTHLLTLLTDLNGLSIKTGTIVRVLLLARSMGFWWPALVDRLDGEFATDATDTLLDPLGDQIDPAALYTAARQHFAERLAVTGTEFLDRSHDHRGDNLVLGIHMTALVDVDAYRLGSPVPAGDHQASVYLLRREYTHWKLTHCRAEDPVATPDETMRRTVYLATLIGAQPRELARAALANAELVSTVEGADQVIDDHRQSYPATTATTVFEPLHPDRLGEDFLALIDPRNPHRRDADWLCDDWALTVPQALLTTGVGATSRAWTSAVMTILVETARRWPHIATGLLYPLVRDHPELAIAAGGPTIARMTTLDGVDLDALSAIDALLPTDRHVDLDVAAAAVSAALTPLHLADSADRADRAQLLANHAWRLSNAGRRDEALATAQEATHLYRQLADANPAAYLPNLATSLGALASVSAQASARLAEALEAVQEAITIFGSLAEQVPQRFTPYLILAYSTLADVLDALGRADDASEIRRQLARS